MPKTITLIEPFFTGSHAAWAREYTQHSEHNIDILSLSGKYWNWRMHGGAITLARKFLASGALPDLTPLILWNHRWEYDKNPEEFLQALFRLDEQGLDFRVAILGKYFCQQYPIF